MPSRVGVLGRRISTTLLVLACLCCFGAASAAAAPYLKLYNDDFPGDKQVFSIARGPDASVYFVLPNADRIGRLAPDGSRQFYGDSIPADAKLYDIVSGPDGKLWFTDQDRSKIGRLDPVSGQIDFFDTQTPAIQPRWITVGPDGNLWFTASTGRIGKITTSGVATDYPDTSAKKVMSAITSGPGNKLYVVYRDSAGQTSFNTDGAVVASTDTGGTDRRGLTRVGDKLFYLAQDDDGTDRFGIFDESLNTVKLSDRLSTGARLEGLELAPDGALWASEFSGSGLRRIETTEPYKTTRYDLFNSSAGVRDLTTGSDGNLWVSMLGGRSVGRITIAEKPPSATTNAPTRVGTDTAVVGGTVAGSFAATTAHIQYGTTRLTTETADVNIGEYNTAKTFTQTLPALQRGVTYQYRVVATNQWGTVFGDILTFATPPADRDGDGHPDNVDACPDAAAADQADGCPLRRQATTVKSAFRVARQKRGRRVLYTKVTRFKFTRLPANAKVTLRCSGLGCKFRTFKPRVSGQFASAPASLFKSKLKNRVKITATITAPGYYTFVKTYAFKNSPKGPKISDRNSKP